MIRKAVVAGRFYPAVPGVLNKELEHLMPEIHENKVIAGIVPHAGYMYSGKVAAKFYSYAKIPNTIVILGPNHTGYGKKIALMASGVWQTPLGGAEICTRLAEKIREHSPHIEEDHHAHLSEHSIEVQLPFLQKREKSFSFVPIAFKDLSLSLIREVAKGIAEAVMEYTKEALLLASTDLSHYEPQKVAEEKDKRAIEAMLSLDEEELIKRVEEENITMCGAVPTAVLLCAAKFLGAKKAELLLYCTSGDVTGDYSQVVGYCALAIT